MTEVDEGIGVALSPEEVGHGGEMTGVGPDGGEALLDAIVGEGAVLDYRGEMPIPASQFRPRIGWRGVFAYWYQLGRHSQSPRICRYIYQAARFRSSPCYPLPGSW